MQRARSFMVVCLLAAGCFGQSSPLQTPSPEVKTVSSASTALETYRLEPGDSIEIRFFYNQELNEKVELRPDGYISMPLVGQVPAAELTIEELTAKLRELYKPIVKQPEITVQVRGIAGRRYIVGGEVQRPGMFAMTTPQTLLGAVMEAGGLKASSQRKIALVYRKKSGSVAEVIPVMMAAKNDQVPPAATFMLRPYDMVIVLESGISKANRVVDQYIRQMMPFIATAGFNYLLPTGGIIQ